METRIDRDELADAILSAGEADAFTAWTLEELENDLGRQRPAFARNDNAGG